MTGNEFGKEWPYRIRVRDDLDWAEAFGWLLDRALLLDVKNHDLYTSFSAKEYGFKDPKMAMEFKLQFG